MQRPFVRWSGFYIAIFCEGRDNMERTIIWDEMRDLVHKTGLSKARELSMSQEGFTETGMPIWNDKPVLDLLGKEGYPAIQEYKEAFDFIALFSSRN